MRTYRIAQGTLVNVCGYLNGKEIQKGGGGYICKCIADTFCRMAETNKIL